MGTAAKDGSADEKSADERSADEKSADERSVTGQDGPTPPSGRHSGRRRVSIPQ